MKRADIDQIVDEELGLPTSSSTNLTSAVAQALRTLVTPTRSYPWIREVCLLTEEIMGCDTEIADIHAVLLKGQVDGLYVLYPCDNPRALGLDRALPFGIYRGKGVPPLTLASKASL